MHNRLYHAKSRYRSGLEEKVMAALLAVGIAAQYEAVKIPYTVPSTEHTYTPDFLLPNGVLVETKGQFDLEDRKKMLLVREQHPALDIRLVFSNANGKIRKGSPTTYAMWAEKNGFKWSHKIIPQEWLTEKPCEARSLAVSLLIR